MRTSFAECAYTGKWNYIDRAVTKLNIIPKYSRYQNKGICTSACYAYIKLLNYDWYLKLHGSDIQYNYSSNEIHIHEEFTISHNATTTSLDVCLSYTNKVKMMPQVAQVTTYAAMLQLHQNMRHLPDCLHPLDRYQMNLHSLAKLHAGS